MTLFKQFLIGALFFTVVILGVVGIADYFRTNEFISNQLGANAKHTAVSLSLVILNEANKAPLEGSSGDDELHENSLENASHPKWPDYSQVITKEFLEANINPIFDSGYYSKIAFKDAKSNVVFEAKSDKTIFGVNDWFIKLIDIPTPVASQEIRSWQKIGTIEVQISPAFAYSQMYSLFKDLIVSLVVVFLCAFLVLYFAIKAMLAPLSRVRKQAEAILEREFIIQEKLPFTQEVRKVVLAMNTMVGKVKNIFEKEAQMLDRYNELLYIDEASKLHNRRYFTNKFKEYSASEQYSSGYFMLLSIKETYNLKKFLGFAKSVEFIQEVAKILNASHVAKPENVYRLNENDFGVIVFDKYDLVAEFRAILEQIKKLFKYYELDENEFVVKAAFTHFERSNQNELLSKADLLLMQNSENFSLNGSLAASSDVILGKQEYKDFIIKAIRDDHFYFASQNVLENDEILQEELYLRLRLQDGSSKSAAYFMPIVNELNICEQLDFYVLKKALELAKNNTHQLAINISSELIKSKHQAQLSTILESAKGAKISFELAMNKELKINEVIAFAKFIRKWGLSLGLDHFGLSKENLMILNELNVSYVKTPVSMLLDLLEDSSASGAANSLEIILNSKNVKIIAIGIENELSANAAKKLNLSALQGRFISEIKDI